MNEKILVDIILRTSEVTLANDEAGAIARRIAAEYPRLAAEALVSGVRPFNPVRDGAPGC
jgi:hypothetical protein